MTTKNISQIFTREVIDEMTAQEKKILNAYRKLLSLIEENPEDEKICNELIDNLHADVDNWDGESDIEFINKYLDHKDLNKIAADPKKAIYIFPGIEKDYVDFMNSSNVKHLIKNLFKLRKENTELLNSNDTLKFRHLSYSLAVNSFLRYLENSKMQIRPLALVIRFYNILFSEISTTISNYDSMYQKLLYLRDNKKINGTRPENIQWQIRYTVDKFLIKYGLFDEMSKWARAAIARYLDN